MDDPAKNSLPGGKKLPAFFIDAFDIHPDEAQGLGIGFDQEPQPGDKLLIQPMQKEDLPRNCLALVDWGGRLRLARWLPPCSMIISIAISEAERHPELATTMEQPVLIGRVKSLERDLL